MPRQQGEICHPGPGGYVRKSDVELFRGVAARGHDVILFDQAGGGLSARLSPREYSLARSVADLDALRAKLGLEKISLLGQSFGGTLAYEYVATHPERVERVAITSSGSFAYADMPPSVPGLITIRRNAT